MVSPAMKTYHLLPTLLSYSHLDFAPSANLFHDLDFFDGKQDFCRSIQKPPQFLLIDCTTSYCKWPLWSRNPYAFLSRLLHVPPFPYTHSIPVCVWLAAIWAHISSPQAANPTLCLGNPILKHSNPQTIHQSSKSNVVCPPLEASATSNPELLPSLE